MRTGSQEVMKNTLITEIRLISLEARVHFFVSDFVEEAEGVMTQGQITRGAGGRDREGNEETVLKGFEMTPE